MTKTNEPRGYSDWLQEGKEKGYHDYWKELTRLTVTTSHADVLVRIYNRRKEAHAELLECDVQLDKLIKSFLAEE